MPRFGEALYRYFRVMSKSWIVMSKVHKEIDRIDRHVGKRLAQLRIGANMSQEQLGKVVGISYQQIQKYEQGKNRISASRLYVFSEYFGVAVDSFYPGKGKFDIDEPLLSRIRAMFKGVDDRHMPVIEAFAWLIKQVK